MRGYYLLQLFICFLPLFGCGKSPFAVVEKTANKSVGTLTQGVTGPNKLILVKEQLEVKGFWEVGPLVYDESKLHIVLLNSEGQLTDPRNGTFFVKLWMPGPTMNHGAPPIKITKLGKGRYFAEEVFFIMAGYWDIHFEIKKGDEVLEEVKWGLTL